MKVNNTGHTSKIMPSAFEEYGIMASEMALTFGLNAKGRNLKNYGIMSHDMRQSMN